MIKVALVQSNENFKEYMSLRYPRSMWPKFPFPLEDYLPMTPIGNFSQKCSLMMSDGDFGVFKEDQGFLSISFSLSTNGYAVDFSRHYILGIEGFKLISEEYFGSDNPRKPEGISATLARAAVMKARKECF